MTGRIARLCRAGYGFIHADDQPGVDLFFDGRHTIGYFERDFSLWQRVEFNRDVDQRGRPCARDVRPLAFRQRP